MASESVPKEEQAGRRGKRWVPLEANPDVLNSFALKLGAVNIGGTESHHSGGGYSFQDVYGLDEELLAMVPQPVLAVILLYPLTEASETARLEGGYICKKLKKCRDGWAYDVYCQ